MPRKELPLHMRYSVGIKDEMPEPYTPPDEETESYIKAVYCDVESDIQLRNEPLEILNDRTITTFWNDSLKDWNVYTKPKKKNDIVKPYASSISRDKSNAFIANLIANAQRPAVVAQNAEQDIDREASRVFKTLSEHAFRNDGGPSSNGREKRLNYCTTLVVEGTTHVQEDVVDGECTRTLVDNAEILIPNYWQPDIQKQAHVIRLTNNVSFSEAALLFGGLDNFKYVRSGRYQDWGITGSDFFKNYDNGLSVDEGRVQIIRAWYPVPNDYLPKNKRRAKYFNILINGVPMFSWDNIMSYRHGFYPIGKGGLEPLHPQFYWYNSLPNKIREDKNWRDSWKTLLRARHKLTTLPPMVTMNGLVIDEDIYIPSKVTPINGDIRNLAAVPGLVPINTADVNVMQLAEKEMDEGTAPPITSGQSPQGAPPTARQIATVSAFSQINRGPYVDRFFALEAGLEALRLSNIAQFYTRKKINNLAKISVGDSLLRNGSSGTIEILFEKIPDEITDEQRLQVSEELLREQRQAEDRGERKEIMFVDPDYARNLNLFVAVKEQGVSDLEFAKEIDAYDRMKASPVFNQEEVGRDFLRALGKDEERLIAPQPKLEEQAPVLPPGVPPGRELAEELGISGPGEAPPELQSARPSRVERVAARR